MPPAPDALHAADQKAQSQYHDHAPAEPVQLRHASAKAAARSDTRQTAKRKVSHAAGQGTGKAARGSNAQSTAAHAAAQLAQRAGLSAGASVAAPAAAVRHVKHEMQQQPLPAPEQGSSAAQQSSVQESAPARAGSRRVPSRLQPWSCPACTLVNAGARAACKACETPKPASTAGLASSTGQASPSIPGRLPSWPGQLPCSRSLRSWLGVVQNGAWHRRGRRT